MGRPPRHRAGLRAAFDTRGDAWGFTPLINRSFPIRDPGSLFKAYFVEVNLPVRFLSRPGGGGDGTAVTFQLHVGLGF